MGRRSFKPKKEKKFIEPHVFEAGDLKKITRRLQQVDKEIAALQVDRKQILIEAKGQGFHPKLVNKVVRELKLPTDDKAQKEKECLELYRAAVGLEGLPLGDAAAQREKNKRPAGVGHNSNEVEAA